MRPHDAKTLAMRCRDAGHSARDWVGAKTLFLCVCFFFLGGGGVIPYGGEKHINKIPPKIQGQSREMFTCFFSLCEEKHIERETGKNRPHRQ